MAHGHGFPSHPMSVTVELQINQKSGARSAVGNKISHQNVKYVGIDLHPPVAADTIAGSAAHFAWEH
jgi:hypothetical protein